MHFVGYLIPVCTSYFDEEGDARLGCRYLSYAGRRFIHCLGFEISFGDRLWDFLFFFVGVEWSGVEWAILCDRFMCSCWELGGFRVEVQVASQIFPCDRH